MDGVFMRKLIWRIGVCFLFAAFVWCGTLLADWKHLNEELIRLHIVAISDSAEDQTVKPRVRDAVIENFQSAIIQLKDTKVAKAYLLENLPKIQAVVNAVLTVAGCDYEAAVTLCQETFDTRNYDTFSLPAGIYHALSIILGEGRGEN